MGCIIRRTTRHVSLFQLKCKEYLGNEVVKKEKLIGASRLSDLTEDCTKIYENEAYDKTRDSNHGPIMNAPHMELSPCARKEKRNNTVGMCHSNNNREHICRHEYKK